MVDFKLSSTKQNGKVKSRKLEYNGKEYDLTDEPILWYGASSIVLSMLSIVLSALLYITAEIFVYLEKTGVIDGLIGVTTKIFQVVLILFFIFVVMGVVKYYVTGSPEPFVSVDISKSSETHKEE
jgi:hypothetical protein